VCLAMNARVLETADMRVVCAEYSADGSYAQHIKQAFSAASAALMDLVTKARPLTGTPL